MFTKCITHLTTQDASKLENDSSNLRRYAYHSGGTPARWGHLSLGLLPRAAPPSTPCAASSSPPPSRTWSWCAVRASPPPQESRKVETFVSQTFVRFLQMAYINNIWRDKMKCDRCIDWPSRTSDPRPLASTSRYASTTSPIRKQWVEQKGS